MKRDKFFFRNIVLHSQNKVTFFMITPGHNVAKKLKIYSEFKWEVFTHRPYSPDLAPSDYHHFRFLSYSLRGNKNLIERWQKQ